LAKQQRDKPSRSEAIRRLIESALSAKTKTAKQPRRQVDDRQAGITKQTQLDPGEHQFFTGEIGNAD
jgi:hypothetical protein